MKCSSCGKPLAAGTQKCAGCGKTASGDYSYDLLPDEPKKEESEKDTFALPPGSAMPGNMALPGPGAVRQGQSGRPGERSRGASLNQGGFSYKKLGLTGAVLAILVLIGMKMCGGSGLKITGSDRGDAQTTLYSTAPKVYNFQIVGEAGYTFTVEALDGDVAIGLIMRSARDPINAKVVKTWSLTPVRKGESHKMENTIPSGSYSFVISTESKTAVKVKYAYRVK